MLESSNPECNGEADHENQTACTAVCEDSPTNREETKHSSVTEETQKPYVSRKVTLSNRKQSSSSVDEKVEEPKEKKSKWGNFATVQKNSQNINISTSSLKSWFPDFKLINETVPVKEFSSQQNPSVSDGKINNQLTSNEERSYKQVSLMSSNEFQQDASLEEEPVEHGPVSNILFIQNLVRPFTLLQLKDLLRQSGNLIEEEFWIDKIKSKCIAVYETEEAAVKTKNRLNNTRWPLSNPKILIVQYIAEDDVEFRKNGGEPTKTVREPSVEIIEPLEVKTSSVEENKRKDKECRKEREKLSHMPKREWDKHKIAQDSPEKERMNKENEKYKAEKKEKKESRRRINDDTPAKLLDDLFQKTKSSPCIYWLPLTEEQVRVHAEGKHLQRLDRQKRSFDEKVPEDRDRKNKVLHLGHRSREREASRSSSRSRSRSPVTRRR